ncbi:hypothetical protein OH799_30525 [Nocardia sp. NBC_00881]|uniref:hypothetical protein n=1 Tax=Nocardia sp. NBC_00881 TaxID=2975995 RepID=UPI0038692D4D|nr:hypothetical protein OH799_30525 [Nocardia sp. NBC_00881]
MPTIGTCTTLLLPRDRSVSNPARRIPGGTGRTRVKIGADSTAMLLYYLLLSAYLADAITPLLD